MATTTAFITKSRISLVWVIAKNSMRIWKMSTIGIPCCDLLRIDGCV